MINYADIDIDMKNRNDLLCHLRHVPASIQRKDKPEKHNSGVYFQPIPLNPLENVANIDHNRAAELGYFKIDLLNNSIYQKVESEDHLNALLEREPTWDMLEDPEIVKELFHLNNHVELTTKMKPMCIDHLAMLLALIRPAKSYLRYQPWDVVEKDVWKKENTDSGYFFKKSHSYAFAMVIVVQLNLIREEQNDT